MVCPGAGKPWYAHNITQETTAMLFAYTNATLLLKWSKERSDVQTQVSKGKKSD